MTDMIDLTNTDLGVENLGESWTDFIERCTKEQAKVFNESYNLITISFPNSFLDNDLTNLFIDEGLDTSDLISHVRQLFIVSIVDALQIMGIIIDMDYVTMDSLHELNIVLDTIYMADGITDLIGLVDLLHYEDFTAKDRFIGVMKLIQPQFDFSNMDYMIKDVSINTIRGLLIGINVIDEDDETFLDPQLKKRINNNKPFFTGTLAYAHIINAGGLGQDFSSYSKLFVNELGTILVDNPCKYLKNIMSLMLISAMTDEEIIAHFETLAESVSTSVEELYTCNKILEEIVINA